MGNFAWISIGWIMKKLKAISLYFVLFLSPIFCAGCDRNVTWEEEVKLNDGRIVVVEQRRRPEGSIAREAWLTVNVPELSKDPIVWHESLRPIILNLDKGNLYVVGEPPTLREARQYGCPSPGYIAFVWDQKQWRRISFTEIPEKIYGINLLLNNFPPKAIHKLTLERKGATDLNGENVAKFIYSRIDPKTGSGC